MPNVVLEVETIEAAKRMVERGLGLAFLPRLAAARALRSRRFVAIAVTDAGPLSRSLNVISSRERPRSAEALTFLRTHQATLGKAAGAAGRMRSRRG